MAPLSIAYGDQRIAYSVHVRPAAHRRVAIHVLPDGTVRVDAPPEATLPQIQHALRQRAAWVWQQLQARRGQRQHVLPREYLSGETHLYLGRRHLLKVLPAPAGSASVRLWRGRLEVTTPARDAASVRRLLEAWYRERAAEVFARAIADIAPRLGVAPPPWRLRAMRTQWGSCSPRGELLLNPHLVKAPRSGIEYVVAHELCHLREHHHGARFHRLLESVLPDWAARKRELDAMAEQLLNR